MTRPDERSESGNPIYRYEPRQKPFEHAVGDPESIEKISAHAEKHLGKVGMVFHEVVSDLVHVDVHHIEPTPERNFHTLFTTGMSDRPMKVPQDAPDAGYAELLICLPPSWPLTQEAFKDDANYWPVRWLKLLARFPHEYDTWLGQLHSMPNGDPPQPLSPDTKLCGVVLAPPILSSQEFWSLDIRPGKRVHFFAIVPVYAEEMEFKLKHGGQALLDQFDEHEVSELLDPRRANTCRKKFFGLF